MNLLWTCSAHIDFSLPLPNTHNTSSFTLLTIIITLYSSINSRVVITMERKVIRQWVKAGEPYLTFGDSAVLVHDQNETTHNDQSTLRHYSNYCLAGNIKFERPNPHTVINTLSNEQYNYWPFIYCCLKWQLGHTAMAARSHFWAEAGVLCGSVGRAWRLQCQGCGFDSHWGPVWKSTNMYACKSLWIRMSAKWLKCKTFKYLTGYGDTE